MAAVWSIGGCSSPRQPSPPASATSQVSGRNLSARLAQVVVTDVAAPGVVSMKVGQTLGIVAPTPDRIYQLDFSSDYLRLLTPSKAIAEPGDRGWVFEAVAGGELEVQIVSRAKCPNPPCNENPAKYTVTVKIGSLPGAPAAPRESQHEPDQPDAAIHWRQIFERDEFGVIAPNGLVNANRQMRAMRDRQLNSLVAGAEPPPAAGISPGGWTWIGPGNIGGRVRAIAVHPTTTSTIFAGSVSGGIWKTTDSGVSWNVVDDFMSNLAVSAIVFNPANSSIMYAGTGEGFFNADSIQGAGIFKSTNGGSTWTQLAATATSDFYFVTELAISADGTTILASTSTGIWRSTNAGVTWSRTLSQSTMQDVKFVPGSSTLVVASGKSKNCYWSTDGGATFFSATGMTTGGSKRVELGVSVSSPNVVYAAVDELPNSEIWKSTNWGQTYALVYNQAPSLLNGQGWYDNTVWVDPTNVNHILIGGVSVYASTDGGMTFGSSFTSGHVDNHVFVSDPGFNGTTNLRVYAGNDGGLSKWENINTTGAFTRLNNNFGVTQFYGADGLTSNGKIFGGTQDNGTLLYTIGGGPQGWTSIAGGDGGFSTADRLNNYLYGEFQWLDVHRSLDGANSASITGCSKSAPYRLDDGCSDSSTTTNFVAPILIDPNSPDRLYAGGVSLWRTTDPRTPNTPSTGPSWAIVKPSISSAISAIAIAPGDSEHIWVGHNNGDVYTTTDGLDASPVWVRRDTGAPGLPNRAVSSIVVDPLNSSHVWVAFGGYSTGNLWVTTNNGLSWSSASGTGGTQLPSAPVRSVVAHPTAAGWIYAGTDVGVFASQDGGASWSLPQDGPANVAVFQLFFMGTTLVAATHGRGLFTVDVPDPASPPSITTQPASQTIGSGTQTTLTVVASGSAPFSYQWYQGQSGNTLQPVPGATDATFTTPSLTSSLGYWVRVSNANGTADSNTALISVANPLATYDATRKTPGCVTVASDCDTGPTLILGRGTITGGNEPNRPNTISNSCPDGNAGTFHSDESIDRLKVTSVDGTLFAAGKTVRIDTTVWAFGITDRLDLFYAANAASPSWVLITSINPSASGAAVLSATYTLPAGAAQAVRAVFRYQPPGAPIACGAGAFDEADDLTFAVGAMGPPMIQNGDFSNGTTSWQVFDGENIVNNGGAGGEFDFHRNPVVTGTGQAVIFQNTGVAVANGTGLTAAFDIGNLDAVRKRMSVLIIDANFSDIAVCTFWLAPNAPMRRYGMSTHATKDIANVSLYFYTASNGTGDYRLDNVSLSTDNTASSAKTVCTDPTAAAASSGSAGPELLTNGAFEAGLTGWSTFFDITQQVSAGVFEFIRPGAPGVPAGGLQQSTGQAMSAGQILTLTFQLGNSSSVRKRVTVLLLDQDFSDLTACTFWLPPGQALSNYGMRWASTKPLANATVTVYGATVGPEQWTRIDNMSLQATPASVGFGTDCVEPGATLSPSPAPAPAPKPVSTALLSFARAPALSWRPKP